jgi:putative peptide zinc metalloprotease protein
VTELRPLARWTVSAWVLTVVPALALLFVVLLWSLPAIIGTAVAAIQVHAHSASVAFSANRPIDVVFACLSIVLLVLPIAGLGVLFGRMGLSGLKAATKHRATAAPRLRRGAHAVGRHG